MNEDTNDMDDLLEEIRTKRVKDNEVDFLESGKRLMEEEKYYGTRENLHKKHHSVPEVFMDEEIPPPKKISTRGSRKKLAWDGVTEDALKGKTSFIFDLDYTLVDTIVYRKSETLPKDRDSYYDLKIDDETYRVHYRPNTASLLCQLIAEKKHKGRADYHIAVWTAGTEPYAIGVINGLLATFKNDFIEALSVENNRDEIEEYFSEAFEEGKEYSQKELRNKVFDFIYTYNEVEYLKSYKWKGEPKKSIDPKDLRLIFEGTPEYPKQEYFTRANTLLIDDNKDIQIPPQAENIFLIKPFAYGDDDDQLFNIGKTLYQIDGALKKIEFDTALKRSGKRLHERDH